MIQLFSGQRRKQRDQAESAYYCVLEASRRPFFYIELGAPDTVDGRFDMLVIHLFAFLSPLMKRDEEAGHFTEVVSEVFVTDMDSSLRDLGISDTKMAKRMRRLYGAFGGRMTAYDEASNEGPEALSMAINRNLFPESANQQASDFLADYVYACLTRFSEQPIDDFRSGALDWPSLDGNSQ